MSLITRHPRYMMGVAAGLLCTLLLHAFQSFPSQGLGFMTRPHIMSIRHRLERQEDAYTQTIHDRHAFIRKMGPTPDKVVPCVPKLSFLFGLLNQFDCPYETTRLGTMGDGGKWICGLSRLMEKPNCVVYSAGISTDSSFEADILRKTQCQVLGFDFSVDKFGPEIENFASLKARTKFYKYAISGKDDYRASPPRWTLRTLMERHGHAFIDILKIDIEGAEFEVLAETIKYYVDNELPLPFGQLQLEIHSGNVSFEKFLKWWEALEAAGLRPFHTEVRLKSELLLKTLLSSPPFSEYSFLNVRASHEVVKD
ncbi:methyltransferase FkbM domain protein [Rhizoctonia solani AG-3 Rhs1AP]|uniref:Methyltransferase FkbM domain protein n=2 Tax=Rhizoctonia solani AG-3 TaxID=1086053 RepID=A0A074RW42_9AGAM|nr:methyltransferase FkbM domain protein [Rhizoctonia solani AG-3 Rhs1AP]KEP51291.1 methyltransferase FkbM domain protein [Rhizoctonia solani 123E]